MIFTESTIKISNNSAKMDSTIVLYRGDKNIEIRFTILQSPFKYSNTVATNVIESTNASYGQLVIKTPNDKPPIFSDVSATKEGTVLFTITKEMIDEIEELGVYTFQIRLMDENKQSRVTIPPVENGIEIKEPIAIEDDNTTNVVGLAKANYAVATLSDTVTPTFDDNGKYNKTNWNDGDIITNASLNKIEDGIYTTNENVTATKKYVDDRFVCTDLIENVGTIPKEEMQKCNNGTSRYVSSIKFKEFFADYKYCVYQGTYGDKNILMKYDAEYNRMLAYDLDIADTYDIMLGFDFDTNYMYPFNGGASQVKAYQFTNDLVIVKNDILNPSEVLTKNNTHEYTPTTDYNPATKKYVDDNKIAYTISSKVLTTVPASNIKISTSITVNNVSINKDRRYYIQFLGSKKLCSLLTNEEGTSIICSIGNYAIESYNDSPNIIIYISKINKDDTTNTFTDLVIYEEEVKYLNSKYLETDLVLQNSISLGRVGDIGKCSSAIGYVVKSSGDYAHAEGYVTTASGAYGSHAEGDNTESSGESSHAEGVNTIASGASSHAEGNNTKASGMSSHTEGDSTTASGNFSHAEGNGAKASGGASHAEGSTTISSGDCSHAEGVYTTASGYGAHSEGNTTIASGDYQHVQGQYNIEDTENKYAHIVGNGEDDSVRSNAHTLDWQGNAWYAGQVEANNLPYTISSKVLATVPASNIKLDNEITINNVSIKEDRRYYIEFLGSKKLCSLLTTKEQGNGIICNIGNYAIQVVTNSTNISLFIIKINEDDTTTDTFTDLVIYEEEIKCLDSKYLESDLVLQNSISLGRIGKIGGGSSAIGMGVTASGDGSHAEGSTTKASGLCSHAEGESTKAIGDFSHSEGDNTTASGTSSHAEGDSTTASSNYSHSEGNGTTASGTSSHAEGDSTIASGFSSHVEGYNTVASAGCSHAEGDSTKASSENQHVQGKYNIEDTANKYAHIVGNGDEDTESNAHTLDWQGNAWFAGKLSQEGTPTENKDLVTKKYVDDKISSLPQFSFNEAGELVVTINGVSKTFVPKNV